MTRIDKIICSRQIIKASYRQIFNGLSVRNLAFREKFTYELA